MMLSVVLSPKLFSQDKKAQIAFKRETYKSFPYIEVEGSYHDIGFEIGRNFGENIKLVLEKRKDWFAGLKGFAQGGGKEYFEALMKITRARLPHLVEELEGISRGAGIDYEDLFLLNVKSEMGARMKVSQPETPGCSTIHLLTENERMIAHNEDGHMAYRGQMFMLKATPPSGVSFIAMVYPGTLTGNGPCLNSEGLGQTTNFIGCKFPKIGIPRYFLNRAVIEAKNLKDAIRIATMPGRAFAFHHNFCSFAEKKTVSVEVTPDNYSVFYPSSIYYHTNHNLHEKTKYLSQDEEYVNSSSMSRYKVLAGLISGIRKPQSLTEKDLIRMLSSHKSAPYSPCRHPDGDVHGVTLGTGVLDVKRKQMKIYKGNPCIALENDRYTVYR
jgi:isopenicillin-N N-acyltransferase-like protein